MARFFYLLSVRGAKSIYTRKHSFCMLFLIFCDIRFGVKTEVSDGDFE